jgi:hypothetical protein
MMVPVDEIPAKGLQLSPRFWASEDVTAETAAWDKAVARRRTCLERAVELAADSRAGKRARAVLQQARHR